MKMKNKKFRDLTLEEMNIICLKNKNNPCWSCPIACVCGFLGHLANEDLDKTIEFEENL